MSKFPFIYFVHIEKAGGITMHNILHNNLASYISPYPHVKYGEFILDEDVMFYKKYFPFKLEGIGGHRLNIHKLKSYRQANAFSFTFLRNPINRFLSHLNWQKNIMNINWTLESFCDDHRFHNFQTYRIAGIQDLDLALDLVKNHFSFVGLMERYDISLVLMKDMLGQAFDIRYEKSNIKNYKGKDVYKWDNLTIEQKALVQKANSLDLKLYKYVEEKNFTSYLSNIDSALLTKEVDLLSTKNRTFSFPKHTLLKRKLSNFYLRRFVQPRKGIVQNGLEAYH